ncbi:MAG: hypothetical protein GY750_17795 [Lentisphaerae bacterium]|nr:hypothetical protein [Lentisphaerota bacterium]MCP4103253.1 hypothetical protein [Lentisphaerota bacterium]
MVGYVFLTLPALAFVAVLAGSLIYFLKKRDWWSGLQFFGMLIYVISVFWSYLIILSIVVIRLPIPMFLNLLGLCLFAIGYLGMALKKKRKKGKKKEEKRSVKKEKKKK